MKRSNTFLKAETKAENLTVDIEEYNRVKDHLVRFERDYGKLVWARDHLETKVREQKDSLRQWKEYRKSWILKHPNKRLSHLQPTSAKASSPTIADDRRSSSAPAPPALPEDLTPSASAISRYPSPHRSAPRDPKDKENRHGQILEHHNRDWRSQSREVHVSQAELTTTKALGSGDVTDATPESEGQVDSIKIDPIPGGSSPIILFERSLKRRHSAKANVQNIHVREDDQRRSGASSSNLPPKDEQISSPIQAPPLKPLDGPYDSVDLDDVGGHLNTPRKRQRMAQERLKSSLMLPLTAAPREGDMPDDMTVGANLRHNEEDSEIEGERDKEASSYTESRGEVLGKTAEEEKKARRDEKMARQHAHNDRVYQRLEAAERMDPIFDPPRSSSPTFDESAQQSHMPNDPQGNRPWKTRLDSPVILQPRDVNASVLPRTSDTFARRKRPCPPRRRDRGAAYVPLIAEDGEGTSNGDSLKAGRKYKDDQNNLHGLLDKEAKAPPTHHRLGALLTRPSPEKSLLIPEEPVAAVSPDQAWSTTPTARSVYHSRSKGPTTPRSLPAKRSELKHDPGNKSGLAGFEPIDAMMDRYSKSAQAVTKRTKDIPAFNELSRADYSRIRPEHEPLRARPVHRLGLQDFKLNPAHSDHAYHESVRKHDEKKSLSGCTDRHCPRCKGLRKHVTDSGYKTAQKPGESEEEADWRLMQTFLGDNHRQLRSMSTKERSELLLEAKVKEFANRYGCHRQAFPRAREPPGLWDVDFPTTQEEAENRAAADVLEREKVQERYWEATRPNGKWLFADE